MNRPLIGVSCALSAECCGNLYQKAFFYHVFTWYCDSIWKAGGRPVIIPPVQGSGCREEAEDVLSHLDGVFFSGGGMSTRAPASPPRKLMESQPIRSEAEVALIRMCREKRIPTIGSCRGHQMICEALGGKLGDDALEGHSQPFSYTYPFHPIRIMEGSLMGSIVGQENWDVNSMHTQYVERCPEGFAVNAFSEDGIIEGMEAVDPDWFCLTFQFHPEMMIFDERAEKLMQRFVDEARKRMKT